MGVIFLRHKLLNRIHESRKCDEAIGKRIARKRNDGFVLGDGRKNTFRKVAFAGSFGDADGSAGAGGLLIQVNHVVSFLVWEVFLPLFVWRFRSPPDIMYYSTGGWVCQGGIV